MIETEDLKIEPEILEQLYIEQTPAVMRSYSYMRSKLIEEYSLEFVEDHPEVAASLAIALELKVLSFALSGALDEQTSRLVENFLYHLKK